MNHQINKNDLGWLNFELENRQPPNGQLISERQQKSNCGTPEENGAESRVSCCEEETPSLNAKIASRQLGMQEFASLVDSFETNAMDERFYAEHYYRQRPIPLVSKQPSSALTLCGPSDFEGTDEKEGLIGGHAVLPPYGPLSPANTVCRLQEEERKQRLFLRTGQPMKMCSNCGTTSTPSWRRCPEGKSLLCNACGLYQKLHNKSRPFIIATDGSVKVQRHGANDPTICTNCQTTETPLWRRGCSGECLCNACGLYLKQHNRYRQVRRSESIGSEYYDDSLPFDYEQFDWNLKQIQPNSFSSPAIDLNALESLSTDSQTNPSPNYHPFFYGSLNSIEDRELYERLQYLEDAAAALLSRPQPANGTLGTENEATKEADDDNPHSNPQSALFTERNF